MRATSSVTVQRHRAFREYPHCGWCHKLISEVKSDPELLKDYTFTFHVVPVLGEASHTYAKKLWCSVGTDEEKMQAMLEGDEAMNALPAMTTCPMDDQDHTVMLSKIIGVRGVPFVIAPDGRVSQGKPADIKSFLRGEEPEAGKSQRPSPKSKGLILYVLEGLRLTPLR